MPRARSGDIELDYEVYGEGLPLLLIQGFGASMVMWPREFIEQLVDRGFQVLVFDNRDVGFSTRLRHLRPPHPAMTLFRGFTQQPVDAPYTLHDMADDAVAVLDDMGIEHAHIAGASMGGMIAQCVAIGHQHRLYSATSIMSTTGAWWASLPNPKVLRNMLRRRPKNREGAADQMASFFRMTRGGRFHFDEERIRETAMVAHDRGVYEDGALRQLAAMAATGDRTAALRQVETPFLVIHGTKDPLVPVIGGIATSRAVRNARLKLIEGMGHEIPRGTWRMITAAIHRHAISAASRAHGESLNVAAS